MNKRAERVAATRQRIVEAAIDLHQTVGLASFSAVAERAGVQRHTLYHHFSDMDALLQACRADYLSRNPPPDLHRWREEADPEARLRLGLTELYGYYEANQAMIANVLRDADRVAGTPGFVRLQQAAVSALCEGLAVPEHARAAVWLVTDFYAWRSLVQAGLDPKKAVETAVMMVRCAIA
jgi:AcrR family transcriptional regulator